MHSHIQSEEYRDVSQTINPIFTIFTLGFSSDVFTSGFSSDVFTFGFSSDVFTSGFSSEGGCCPLQHCFPETFNRSPGHAMNLLIKPEIEVSPEKCLDCLILKDLSILINSVFVLKSSHPTHIEVTHVSTPLFG